jgi:hypothetical protein
MSPEVYSFINPTVFYYSENLRHWKEWLCCATSSTRCVEHPTTKLNDFQTSTYFIFLHCSSIHWMGSMSWYRMGTLSISSSSSFRFFFGNMKKFPFYIVLAMTPSHIFTSFVIVVVVRMKGRGFSFIVSMPSIIGFM